MEVCQLAVAGVFVAEKSEKYMVMDTGIYLVPFGFIVSQEEQHFYQLDFCVWQKGNQLDSSVP